MVKDKAWGLFRLEVNGILRTYDIYGMGVHLPETAAEIEKIAARLLGRLEGSEL